MGEAGISAASKGEAGEFVAPITSFSGFSAIRCASPLGGVRIAGLIVLAQHMGNKRIGVALTTIRSALPIVIEIGY
jgi:hypothetical protein